MIPGGTYVGFEDLAASVADYNYTDGQFVFTNTNVVNGASPEPMTMGLVGLALAGFVDWPAGRTGVAAEKVHSSGLDMSRS